MTYILDGGTHNDPFNNLNLPLPFPDAMQEFKVETSALPAQYGHHSAAAVNAVTKSGTNVLHGGAFEFMRDYALNATNAFAAIGPDGKRRTDGLHRDQFGGTLGGPVVQGKLFYFAGYQGTRINVTPTDHFPFVPTRAMLAGDFSAIASPACNAGRPITLRAPFVNNQSIRRCFRRLRSTSTDGCRSRSMTCGRTLFDRKNAAHRAHVDRPPRLSVDQQPLALRALPVRSVSRRIRTPTPRQPVAYGTRRSITPVHSMVARRHLPARLEHGQLVPGDLQRCQYHQGLRAVLRYEGHRRPEFHAAGRRLHRHERVRRLFAWPRNANPAVHPTKVFQVADDLSLVRGAHQFGLGANFIHSSISTPPYGSAAGAFTFTGAVTGLGLADFLLGRPSAIQQTSINHQKGAIDYFGLYVQDAWRVIANLSLNLGLRWQPYLPYYDAILLISATSAWRVPRRRAEHRLQERAGRVDFPGRSRVSGQRGRRQGVGQLSRRGSRPCGTRG